MERDSIFSRSALSSINAHSSISFGAEPGSSDAVVGMCSIMTCSGYILLPSKTPRVGQTRSSAFSGEHQQSPCSSHLVRAVTGGFGPRTGVKNAQDLNLVIMLTFMMGKTKFGEVSLGLVDAPVPGEKWLTRRSPSFAWF